MALFSRVRTKYRQLAAEKPIYRNPLDWWISLYVRLLAKRRSWPLPFRNRTRLVYLKSIDRPFHIRLASTDWMVMLELFFHDEYKGLLDLRPQDVKTVVDLGANVGMSIRLWQETWPDVAIVAVEPDAENIKVARINCGDKVKLVAACIAATEKTVYINSRVESWAISMSDAAGQSTVAVPAIPMSKLLRDAGVEGTLDLVKCDIEGAEAELFASCGEWIRRVRYLAVEVHEPYTKQHLLRDIEQAGGRFEVVNGDAKKAEVVIFLRSLDNFALKPPH